MQKESIIQQKSFQFSLSVIGLFRMLVEHKEFILSKQLLRSATSIGSNVEEATAAQSKKDFIHKMAIASKEARETVYWLRLLGEGKLTLKDLTPYLLSAKEISNILTAIVKTSQKNTSEK